MTRRELLAGAGAVLATGTGRGQEQQLAGTAALTWDGDLAERMMDGAHRFVERKIAESVKTRRPDRERLRSLIGAVDPRVPVAMERFADDGEALIVAETAYYRVYQVRWPVLDGVTGEGLLMEPRGTAAAYVIAMGDADQTPEAVASGWARSLAENGCAVLIPTLIDRGTQWSGHPDIHLTDQTHREWIYRQAFHMGRHIIGYEVQKVLAAVDLAARTRTGPAKIGVAGYGEGGLIAFYAAAVDPRIDATLVSGYFDSRQNVWAEPIYRNVWSLLRDFGDAEIAGLIAPRGLTIEHCRAPEIAGPRGNLRTPDVASVRAEFGRIGGDARTRRLIEGGPGSDEAVMTFARHIGIQLDRAAAGTVAVQPARAADRQHRQVLELERHVQGLIRGSEKAREQFFLYKVMPELADETWNRDLRSKILPAGKFIEGTKPYRRVFREEILGQFDDPLLPPNARTRRIRETPRWTGYEVVLDVWPDVFAWGILLVPKDIRAGERRPVVVCQHGRQGLPIETIEGDTLYYRNLAARLADDGFITFSPHNLYRGEDRYRWLSRKANGVKASLFSFIVSQHDQLLRWLGTLPMVDAGRIGFYGLSYGGETAVRVPAVLEGYAASVCSGDFNSWTEKVASTDQRFSYMYTVEWEMPYFNMGSTFDYAEMAYLIAPRPFMVERGHNDRVSRDQWVAYQYAKVRWLYAQLGLADKTEIEFFDGGHTINGEGTFAFLKKHLRPRG
jgi:dienelactone hydrolase